MTSSTDIRVGVFFDGTGLNYINTTSALTGKIVHNPSAGNIPEWFYEVIKAEEKNSEVVIFANPDINANSYIAGLKSLAAQGKNDFYVSALNYSNIYWLYDLYGKNITDTTTKYAAVYVEGVGTQDNIPDNNDANYLGLALGIGKTGAIAKYNKSIYYIKNQLDKIFSTLSTELKGQKITLTFDVFGFSRGAAIARHFANQIFSYTDKNLVNEINSLLDKYDCSLNQSKPTVNFLGLYDTVVEVLSLDGLQNPADCPLIQALPAGIAKHIFQIRALQESRVNFPLHSIAKYYPEVSFLGCHSDVGGSYQDVLDESSQLTKGIFSLVEKNISGLLTQQLSNIKNVYWSMLKTASKEVVIPYLDGTFYKSYQEISDRKVINMQFISLCAMLKVTGSVNTPFDPSGFATYRQKLIKLTNLQNFGDLCIQKALDVFNGKADTPFTAQQIHAITNKYVHISANWGASDVVPSKTKLLTTTLLNPDNKIFTALPEQFKEIWQYIVKAFKKILSDLESGVESRIESAEDFIENTAYNVYEELDEIKNITERILNELAKGIQEFAKALVDNTEDLPTVISHCLSKIIEIIQYGDELIYSNRPTKDWVRTIYSL